MGIQILNLKMEEDGDAAITEGLEFPSMVDGDSQCLSSSSSVSSGLEIQPLTSACVDLKETKKRARGEYCTVQ